MQRYPVAYHAAPPPPPQPQPPPPLSPLSISHQRPTIQRSAGATTPSTGRALPTLSAILHHTSSSPCWTPSNPSSSSQRAAAAVTPTRSRFERSWPYCVEGAAMTRPLPAGSPILATSPQMAACLTPQRGSAWSPVAARPTEMSIGVHNGSPFAQASTRLEEAVRLHHHHRQHCAIRSPNGSETSHSSGHSTTTAGDDTPRDVTDPNAMEPPKISRYLREMDRRAILERLGRGEKQATLAKEYNVSRAAICNLFKHRHEVMARTDEDPFAKHPKKRKKNVKSRKIRRPHSTREVSTHTKSKSLASLYRVHEVQSDSVRLLLTVMSDRRSTVEEFRRSSERVLWLVIEEALSLVPIKTTQLDVGDDSQAVGVVTEHAPCAITMEKTCCPMMDVFQLIEPDRPAGRIHAVASATGTRALHLEDARLPPTLKYHNVFLFDVSVESSDSLCEMVKCVKERGALEVMIYVVALFIDSDVVASLQRTYPHVRVVTALMRQDPSSEATKNASASVEVALARFDEVYHTQYAHLV